MLTEQTNITEAIAQAVARVAVQTWLWPEKKTAQDMKEHIMPDIK